MENGTGVDLIDVDMTQAHVRIQIATEHIGRVQGMISGQAYTPHEWLDKTHALAAINGGYFGREDSAGRKEFVGLLAQGGRVRHAAPPLSGHGGTQAGAGRYVHSVFGITRNGMPAIAYAATEAGRPQSLRRYPSAAMYDPGMPWPLQSGVGCGPMLVQNGHVRVTDRQERLASAGALPRTFVAYGMGRHGPAHFIMGMASGMEYRDLAAFVMRYFSQYDHMRAQAAMCLDGGASTQLSYRADAGSATQSPRETGVSVPDAVVLMPRP
jgi:exopolysaccharide biosynthesis protein